jgi:ComF family protein
VRHFDAARAFFEYAGPAASVIKSYKFKGDYFLGPRFLRGLLASGWLPDGIAVPQAVVPVPLHPRRRRERGYDQALLLARVLARHFRCRLTAGALVRTRYTSQQSLLPVTQRWDNVRGVFAVAKPKLVADRSLLLVDDVLTTGMTAEECAKALKKAGAARVEVLALARTMP